MSTLNQDHIQPEATTSSYHHGNLRETLLSEGLRRLEATSDGEVSLRELSRLIGVSANAVYRHFANKEALLTALAARGFEQLMTAQAEAVQSTPNAMQGFLTAGRVYVHFARQHPALFRLMYGRFAVTHRDEHLQMVAQLAYEGMRYCAANAYQLDMESEQSKIIAARAWSMVHGLSQLIIDGQFDRHADDLDALVERVIQIDLGASAPAREGR